MSGSNEPVTTGNRMVTSNVRQLSDGNPIGTVMGKSATDLISFYAATPVVQPGTNGLPNVPAANLTIYSSTQSPVSVAANTAAEQSLTVTGVLATDMVFAINKPTTQAGLLVGSARVSAANTVYVTFGNDTGSAITPTASQVYTFIGLGSALTTTATLSPTAVAANTTSEQQFTVNGVYPGQVVAVNKPTAQAGLMITNCRVVGQNLVAIQFQNLTASTITPTASEVYTFGSATAFQPAPIMQVIQQTLTPVSVAANTAAEQTFTVPGLIAGTEVFVTKPSVTNNLVVAGARVSAANTLAINFANNTAAAIVPPSETYLIAAFTTEAPAGGSSTILPAQKGSVGATDVQLGLASGT